MEAMPEDLSVLAVLLRALSGRHQDEMAKACGVHPSTLSRYESGASPLPRETLTKLIRSCGYPEWSIEGFFLPFIGAARQLANSESDLLSSDAGWLNNSLNDSLPNVAAAAGLAEFLVECCLAGSGSDAESELHARENRDISTTRNLWGDDSNPPPLFAHPTYPACWQDFEKLAVLLCDESEREASKDAGRALALARRALSLAALALGEIGWRWKLEGYCWAFIGNAFRVACNLVAAGACFATAWRLWEAGSPGPGGRLVEWRLLDLEASLRRARRQFPAALEQLERALHLAPVEAHGRILLKRSFTLEQAGEISAAIAALREAIPLITSSEEPRHSWIVRINLLVLLCHLDRFEDAERELPALVELTEALGNSLDRLRVRWLSARVAAGLGRRHEAVALFEELLAQFTGRHNPYNAALVSLELAALHLEEGKTAEVQTLTKQLVCIFGAQGIHREAVGALMLFCDAARNDAATVELARSTLRKLEQPEIGLGSIVDGIPH